jgi:ketosteroid isomerase-like protein
MQATNIETLRRYHDLLNESGEPPVELFHPEVEIYMFDGSPIPGPYHGREGLQQWRRDTFDVIDSWRIELDEIITGDDPDVMVMRERFVGRMKHTDLEANFPLAVVVAFRDGLIARFQGFRQLPEALDAAGLNDERKPT